MPHDAPIERVAALKLHCDGAALGTLGLQLLHSGMLFRVKRLSKRLNRLDPKAGQGIAESSQRQCDAFFIFFIGAGGGGCPLKIIERRQQRRYDLAHTVLHRLALLALGALAVVVVLGRRAKKAVLLLGQLMPELFQLGPGLLVLVLFGFLLLANCGLNALQQGHNLPY